MVNQLIEIETLFDMNIDPDGVLCYWIYVDSNGEVYGIVEPDASKCSSHFLRGLNILLYGDV